MVRLMFQQRWDGTLNLAADARLAAAPARIWAVETVNGFLRLSEVYPTATNSRVVGNLFTTAGATCHGLTWDEAAGELKALIRVGSAQYIYEINTTDGHAAAPKLIPSGTASLSGLASNGGVLYSFDPSRNLISITATGATLNVSAVTGKNLTGVSATVNDVQTDDGATFTVAAGNAAYTYVRGANTTTAITLPTFSVGVKSSLTKFGNNLYVSNNGAIRFVRANTYTNIATLSLRSSERVWAGAKRSNGTIYFVTLYQGVHPHEYHLYRLNVDGTVVRIGRIATRNTLRNVQTIVWNPHNNKLYLFGQTAVYTVNETTAALTSVGTLTNIQDAEGNPVTQPGWDWGFALSATRFVLARFNGAAYHVPAAGGVVGTPFITEASGLGARTYGGEYTDAGYYTFGPPQIAFKANTTANTVFLLYATSPAQPAQFTFNINGTVYAVATNGLFYKFDSLLPELYERGSPIEYLHVGEPPSILLQRADASVTQILPLAHGGKGPYTYAVRYNNTNTLPNGISYNSASRGLTVDPATVTVGEYILEYKVTDSESPARSVSQSFRVRVGPAAGVTIGTLAVPSPANITINEGESRVVVMPRATAARGNIGYDVDSIDTGYEEDQLPPGFTYEEATNTLEINSSAEAGVHRFRYEVEDGFTTSSDTFTVTVTSRIILPAVSDITLYNNENHSVVLPESSGGAGTRSYALRRRGTKNYSELTTADKADFYEWTWTTQGGTFYGNPTHGYAPGTKVFNGTNKSASFNGWFNGHVRSLLRSLEPHWCDNSYAGKRVLLKMEAINTGSSTRWSVCGAQQGAGDSAFSQGAGITEIIIEDQNGRARYYTRSSTAGAATFAAANFTEQASDSRVAAALPAGVTFDGTTRTLAVAAATSTPGTYRLRYTATVGTGTEDRDFALTIDTGDQLRLAGGTFSVHKGADRTIQLPTATGGDSTEYEYAITEDPENPNFAASLNGSTGVLTVDDSETQVGTYTLRYTVDDGTQTATATVTVQVLAAAATLVLPAPADFTIYKDEQNISQSLPEASGGTTPYTYALVQADDSALPTGITFTPSTRALSLSASQVAVGTFSLKYTVTDASTDTAEQTFTVNAIATRPRALALPAVEDKTYRQAALPERFTLPAATGGSGTKRYGLVVSDNENVDISFDLDTRVVIVSNTASPGRHLARYTVTDDSGTVSINFNINITEAVALPQDIQQVSLFKDDSVFSIVLPEATGHIPGAVYSMFGLATGMSFDASTRTFTVDPAQVTVGRHRVVYAVVVGVEAGTSAFIVSVGEGTRPTPERETVDAPAPAPLAAPRAAGDPAPTDLTVPPLEPLERLVPPACVDEVLGSGEYEVNSGTHSVELEELPAPRFTGEQAALTSLQPGISVVQKGDNDHAQVQFDTDTLAIGRYAPEVCLPGRAETPAQQGGITPNLTHMAGGALSIRGVPLSTTRTTTAGVLTTRLRQIAQTNGLTTAAISFGPSFDNTFQALTILNNGVAAIGAKYNDPNIYVIYEMVYTSVYNRQTQRTTIQTASVTEISTYNFNTLTECPVLNNEDGYNVFTRCAVTETTPGMPAIDRTCQTVNRSVRGALQVCPVLDTIALPTEAAAPLMIAPPPAVQPRIALEVADQEISAVSGCDTFKVTLPRATGGAGEVSYSVGTLPGLIRYIPSQHALVGPESAAQDFDFTLMATDSSGARARATISVTVRPVGFADTPLHKTLLYRQNTIKDLVNRRLALEIDITDMRVYKQEVTLQVRFIADTGVEQSLLDLTDIRAGKFSVLREGERLFLYIAPEVIRGMYGPLQEQTAGCWVLDIRSALEPLRHRTVFGNEDIAEDMLEEEFKRLDIQDQTKIDEIKQTRNVEPSDISTPSIKDEAIRNRHLADGAVQKNSLATESVATDKLAGGAVTQDKLAPDSVTGTKIEQDTLRTRNFGTLSVQKLAKPADKGAVNVATEIDEAAVTTDKLRDGSVDSRALRFNNVLSQHLADGAVDGSKIAPRSLSTHNLQARGFTRELADGEVTGAHLAQGSITRRVLDWLNLGKYFKNSGELLNLPVKNPQQIPPGTPVGMHVLPGDTEPTVFRLTDTYEYAQPEPPAQTERDISIYGDLPEGGTPEGSGETTDDDTTGSGYAKIAIKPLVLKNGTTDTNVTKPYNPGGIGVSALNTMQVNGKWLVAYLVPGVYLHTDTKVYTPGQAVGSAVSGASHDWTIPNNRLNLVIEVRDELRNPETTTQFYMNTVMWHTGIDFTSDRLNPYTAVAMDKIPGAERRGGVYIGLHAGIVDENAFNRHKVLGSNWSVPATAGTPNNLPPARTQLYAFSFSNDTLSSEKNDAYIQTLIEYPRPQNGNKTYKTRSDYRVGSSSNHGADVDATLRAEVAQGYAHLPGLGLSMWAETNSLFVMRRGARGFEDSPEVPLLHFAVPGVGYDRGPRNMCTYWDNAFGRKGTNNNNHWAINFGRAYSDSDASASDLSGIVSRRSSHLTITLPTSVVSRAGINGLRGYGSSRLPGQAGPPITYAALGSINMRTPTSVVKTASSDYAQTHVFNRPVMYSRYTGVEPGSGYNMTLPVRVQAHPGDSANKMDTYLPLYNENTFPPVPSDIIEDASNNLYGVPVANIIQTLPGGTGLWYGKTKVVGTTTRITLNYVRVQQVAFPVLGTLLQTMFVQMVGLGRTTAIASWQHSDNGVDTVNMERRLIRLGDNGDLEYDSE